LHELRGLYHRTFHPPLKTSGKDKDPLPKSEQSCSTFRSLQ
jgi:hypothetical protein